MYIIKTEKIPMKIWASNVEDNALEQAKNLANLPFANHWVALMADAHLGFGMPIGGVVAVDGMVIPNAVGVDIGCGMKARKTNLTEIDKETLKNILHQVQRDVPNGFAHHKQPQVISAELQAIAAEVIAAETALAKVFTQMPLQMGTLGGGNHFIELQKGDDGHIWIMLHSGSRGIGKMVCDFYDKLAQTMNPGDEHAHLAALPVDSQTGRNYLLAMKAAMKFAEDNRLQMLEKVATAMTKFFPDMKVEEAIDTHHNYAALEHHFGTDVYVHRKGAVRAVGKVIIPGSMGTYSYIGEGLENPESFCTCSHGAGRLMGRKEAMQKFSVQSVIEEMKAKKIELVKQKKNDVAEECAGAYKDIDQVMKNQLDLVKPLVKLQPIGVVKG
jgi:tRNA-splicing ligase RtcB